MLTVLALFAAPLALAMGSYSNFADRRLRERGHTGRRYRLGFFLGLSMYILSVVLCVVVVNDVAAGNAPMASAFCMVVALVSARGIGRRKRYGWICLFIVALVYVGPHFVAGIITLQIPGWLLSAGIAIPLTAVIAYAAKRWAEMKPGWQVQPSRELETVMQSNDAVPPQLKPIASVPSGRSDPRV